MPSSVQWGHQSMEAGNLEVKPRPSSGIGRYRKSGKRSASVVCTRVLPVSHQKG